MEVAARPAKAEDIARLVELLEAGAAGIETQRGGSLYLRREALGRPFTASLTLLLGDDESRVVAGTIDEVLLGLGVVRAETLADGTRLARVVELYVEPEARGVGVGEAIMDDLTAWAVESGCAGIDATALPGDRATKNFFETFGLVARAIVVHRALVGPGPHVPPDPPVAPDGS